MQVLGLELTCGFTQDPALACTGIADAQPPCISVLLSEEVGWSPVAEPGY